MYMLRLFDHADAAQPIDARLLRDGKLRIGRDPAADWSIPDPDCEVSRWHCELDGEGSALILRCLGANGTFDDDSGARLPDNEAIALDLPRTIRIGRYRLAASAAADLRFAAGDPSRTMVFTPPLGDTISVPTDWDDAPAAPVITGEGSLLEAFCEGAGLDPSWFADDEAAAVLRRAGAVYRQMVLGIGNQMAERERARARYNLAKTTIGGANNNPFKWAPSQRLAIDLLGAAPPGFLSGPAALKASFEDVKRHLAASFAGMQASLRAAIDAFAPDAIDTAVAPRVSLLKGRGALQWQEVEARHAELLEQVEGGVEGTLDRAYVRAYSAAEAQHP